MALEGGSEQGPLRPSGLPPRLPLLMSQRGHRAAHETPVSTPSAGLLFILQSPVLSCPPLHGHHPSAHPWCHLCGPSLALPGPPCPGTCLGLSEDRDRRGSPVPPSLPFCALGLPLRGGPWAPELLLLARLASSMAEVWAVKEAIFSLCYPRNYLVSVLPCAWYNSARKCQSVFTLRGNGDEGDPHHGVGGRWLCCSENLF